MKLCFVCLLFDFGNFSIKCSILATQLNKPAENPAQVSELEDGEEIVPVKISLMIAIIQLRLSFNFFSHPRHVNYIRSFHHELYHSLVILL
jgi:hypothetical protein